MHSDGWCDSVFTVNHGFGYTKPKMLVQETFYPRARPPAEVAFLCRLHLCFQVVRLIVISRPNRSYSVYRYRRPD
jgi:hypothetical protein